MMIRNRGKRREKEEKESKKGERTRMVTSLARKRVQKQGKHQKNEPQQPSLQLAPILGSLDRNGLGEGGRGPRKIHRESHPSYSTMQSTWFIFWDSISLH